MTEKAVAAAVASHRDHSQTESPPHVESTSPGDGDKDVKFRSRITATFSKPMSGATIDSNTFTIKEEGKTNVEGTVRLLTPATCSYNLSKINSQRLYSIFYNVL